MVFKTIFMFLLFFTLLGIIISSSITNIPLLFGLYILSGLGMAGIGMGIMHDAIRGSFISAIFKHFKMLRELGRMELESIPIKK